MIVYPKAEVTIGRDTRPPDGGVPRGNMHTTETPSSGFYTRTVYYSTQVREYGGRVYWRQFMDLADYSHALRHSSGDPETNKEGSVNPSLAVVGYAKNMPVMSDLLVREIAEFMLWCETELGIPARFVAASVGSSCYGESSPCRVSWSEWKKGEGPLLADGEAGGWYPHGTIPGQTHWDAPFPITRIEDAIDTLRRGESPPADPGIKEGMLDLDVILPVLRLYSGYSSKGQGHLRDAVRTLQGLLLSHGYPDKNTSTPATYADGFFGPGTERSLKDFQRDRGLAVDGVAGSGSWMELLRQQGG